MHNHDVQNLAAMALSFYDVMGNAEAEAIEKYAEAHEYDMETEAEVARERFEECRKCFILFISEGFTLDEIREQCAKPL